MKVYIVLGEEGYPQAVFSNREAAANSFSSADIEEYSLHDEPLSRWKHYERIAEVFPDGSFKESSRETEIEGEQCHGECEEKEPFDGHFQCHCGEHIYISGTNKELVEIAFQRQLAKSIARQDGTCKSQFGNHKDPIDGRLVYEDNFKARMSQWPRWQWVNPNTVKLSGTWSSE